jgi:transposase
MDSELWANIRRLHEIEKLTKSQIALRLDVHRETVRRALHSVNAPPVDKRGRPVGRKSLSKLDAFKTYVQNRLTQYPELSGMKLFKEIQAQGYAGGETILLEYVRPLRPARTRAFLRLETRPGEFAQVDWAHVGTIQIGNAKRKLSCFVMVLSYSRRLYLEFTLSQRLEDFLACHVNALEFFGGVPDKINYDNLRSVVTFRLGKEIRFQKRFMDLAGYYLFDPVPCGVRQPQEKGKVESGIKYVRTAFLAGREILSFYDLQKDAVRWRDEEANQRVHGTTHERPIDRFLSERDLLHPLPAPGFDCSIMESAPATSQSLVHFQTNRYSAPFRYANKTLTLCATPQEIEIYDEVGRRVARHVRSYEKYRVFEKPEHYEGLLAERKKARATKRIEVFLTLAPECEAYLKGLVAAELHVGAHLDKIQDLISRYGKAEVMSALLHALAHKAFGADYIERIVHQQRSARQAPEPQEISLIKKPHWAKVTVEQTDLSLYDELFEKTEGFNEHR